METSDPVGTSMEIKYKLDLDQHGSPVDETKYRSMIGALMYLTSSRPKIVHATCLCARYHAKPTTKHLKEVKRIFCYLRGTVNMGLWYTKDSGFKLTGFSDADYTGCKDTFKSTFGRAQFLGKKLFDWIFHSNGFMDVLMAMFKDDQLLFLRDVIRRLSYGYIRVSKNKGNSADDDGACARIIQQGLYHGSLGVSHEGVGRMESIVFPDVAASRLKKNVEGDCYKLVKILELRVETQDRQGGIKIQRIKDLVISVVKTNQGHKTTLSVFALYIKLKIKIQDHKHAKGSSKEFPRIQGSKT
ncbi:hypothetical protein Tco_1118774 [Tanacetum coccineum]